MFHLKNFVLGIGIIIIFGLLLWQGIEAFYPSPDWNKMCGDKSTIPASTQETCVAAGGRWNPDSAPKAVDSQGNVIAGYCDLYYQCQQDYDEAMKGYNQIRFYIVAVIGFILLLTGLFATENIIQLTGLATGGILVGEGVVLNFRNEIVVFATLLAILIIFGVVAWRVVRKR